MPERLLYSMDVGGNCIEMNRKSRPELLTAPLFLLGLICLLLNDLFLKYEFHNGLTGKLSDFAGLFIFPYFFSAYRPNKAKVFYWATVAIFILWKSPISQSFIDFFNSYGIGVGRVIDYSDLVALLVLPLSFQYHLNRLNRTASVGKLQTFAISAAAFFSFCATTLPQEKVDLKIDTDRSYILEMSKEELFKSLSPGHLYSDPQVNNYTDSLFYLYFRIPDTRADVTGLATVYAIDSTKVKVHLDSILFSYVEGNFLGGVDKDQIEKVKSFRAIDYENLFEEYFIKPVREGTIGRHLYYDNKMVLDSHQINN